MNKSNLTRTSSLILVGTLSLLAIGNASASYDHIAGDGILKDTDMVGVSFWLATAMMLASTVFFILERQNVAPKWRTSMTVAALVTGIAWYHYTYMREHWEVTGESPLVMRYIDWLITVPLQVSEFYLILAAIGVASAALFWRLFGASIVMLVAGFLSEAEIKAVDGMEWPLFIVGVLAWAYIIYELWSGEAKNKVADASEGTQFAFKSMALILTVGWAIYPLGWIMGQDAGDTGIDRLNILYNIADVVNKTAFGLMVWYAATMDTKASSSEE